LTHAPNGGGGGGAVDVVDPDDPEPQRLGKPDGAIEVKTASR
jgi:hypothetical protein